MRYIIKRYLLCATVTVAALLILWQGARLHSLREEAGRLSEQVAALRAEQEEMRTVLESVGSEEPSQPVIGTGAQMRAQEQEEGFTPLDISLSPQLQEHTWELCREYGVPFEIALVMMYTESGFTENAVGYNTNGTFDSGLMQINSVNHGWLLRDYGLDVSRPADNIQAGLLILSMHLENGDLEYALTAYGCGAAGAQALGGTSASARKVLSFDLAQIAGT